MDVDAVVLVCERLLALGQNHVGSELVLQFGDIHDSAPGDTDDETYECGRGD